ncbi:MAG: hypothetical protein LBH85_08640 [Treponema sp.]|jgi:DNA-binding beta-propeller fold protein YncE|nr:hypothetical protein [Treponema sp.]
MKPVTLYAKRFFILCGLAASAAVFAEPSNYTYNYDFWNEQAASPDAYTVSAYIIGASLGVGNFRDPQGLFIKDEKIYVCDSGNNRIVVIGAKGRSGYEVLAVVSSVVIDGEESAFDYPMDIFETAYGEIYITDTNNQRVLCLDKDWNYVSSIVKPEDESVGVSSDFLPTKLVVDFAGRVFVQARNVNKGLMEFDSQGVFVGYMGANKVKVNIVDYAWKLISTQAQRARMDLFIPTEYNNLCLDRDGFIYVTNASGQTDPVRRLNAMGQDILIRNGYEDPKGDLVYGNAGGIVGRSKFIDVAALDNDSYACFDMARGRVFLYDFQGNLLYAFGGVGNREGYFMQPVALEKLGYSLFALDSRTGALTRFDLTRYGAAINEALSEYHAGRYEASAEKWEEVLKMNGNYDLAYIGIGRAALRQGEYQKAMRYYKLKRYYIGYGKAFQFFRKQWMEANLWKILIALGLIAATPPFLRLARKIGKEIREA